MRRVFVGRPAGCVALAFVMAFGGLPAGAATGIKPRVVAVTRGSEVRTVWTAEFGVPRPAGLTYVESRKEFLVAGSQSNGTRLIRLGRDKNLLGTVHLSSLTNPATLAYDSATNQVTTFASGRRTDMAVGTLGAVRPNVRQTKLPSLDLLSPKSAAFDASTGDAFLLTGDNVARLSKATGDQKVSFGRVANAKMIAFNASDGLLYVLDGAKKLHGLDQAGRIEKTFDLAAISLLNPVAMVFAPSTDSTDDATIRNLFVATSGDQGTLGGVTELSLSTVTAVAALAIDNGTLVRLTQTSTWSPGSPDPAGVVHVPGADELVVVDSEVDETTGAGWHNVNMWRVRRAGTPQVGVGTFWGPNAGLFNGNRGFSREPTGAGYDPISDSLLVSDDSADRVFVIKKGPDGAFGTTDDVVGSVNAGAYGSGDTEDPTFDIASGDLFFLDGVQREIYRVDPIDTAFGNGNDVMTHFDISHLGPSDFEGLAFNNARGTLYVGARATDQIFEISTTGTLLRTISVSGVSGLAFVSGLAIAPASNGSGQVNFYIVDRAVDNGANSNENDGRMFEVSAPDSLGGGGNQAPIANAGTDKSVNMPNAVTLNGTLSDDGLPNPPATVTASWSKVSGPGTVNFANPNAAATTATFSLEGSYVLRLTANDSVLSHTDDVTVTVIGAAGQPPVANAGPDQSVTMPNAVTLNGSVSDDGLPNPPGVPSASWSQVSGPGTANFANPNAAATTATFTVEGTYVLRLTASDTILTHSDDVTVTVIGAGGQAPVANAGPDKSVVMPDAVTLSGSVSDDGLPNPPGVPSASWSQVSGPGTANFADPNAAATTATFTAEGTYVLRLTASDTILTGTDDVTVTVLGAGGPFTISVPIAAGSDDAEESSGGGVSLDSSDIELVFDGTDQTVGLRFAGVGIPQGAVILNAYVQFTADETNTVATDLLVQGHAIDNSPTFTTAGRNISLRPRTGQAIAWVPPSWTTVGQAGTGQRTPNLAPVIQELVNRSGWVSGNALSLIITGTGERTAEAFEGTALSRLVIEYQIGGTPVNQPPIANAGPDVNLVQPNSANLNGSITDDGLPTPPALTALWSKVSGPGTVNFGNPNSAVTTATFTDPGDYVLRLTANDSSLSDTDDVNVHVVSANGPFTLNIPIATGNDDVEQRPNGTIARTGSDLELVVDGTGSQTVGLRFVNVPIPTGATIVEAYVQFTQDETGTAAANLLVEGQKTANPLGFTTATNNVSSRPRTTNKAPWVPASWTQNGAAGVAQQTPSLNAVVQELITQVGWASGNAMVFIITGTGTRTAEAFEGTATPVLHIVYTT